jgi:hypothetical protein
MAEEGRTSGGENAMKKGKDLLQAVLTIVVITSILIGLGPVVQVQAAVGAVWTT